MNKKLLTIIFLFLLVVFQSSVFSNFFSIGRIPNLALIVIIFWSTRMGFKKTWKYAFGAGIFSDIFYFYPLGVNVFSFLLISFISNFLAKRFLTVNLLRKFFILILIVGGVFLYDLLNLFSMEIFAFWNKMEKISFNIISISELWKIFWSLLVFFIFYFPLKKFEKTVLFNE